MNLSKPTQVDPHVLLGKYADVGIIRQVNLTDSHTFLKNQIQKDKINPVFSIPIFFLKISSDRRFFFLKIDRN